MLKIISGYSPDEEVQALSSSLVLTTDGPKKEAPYPSLSRLSAAVTLATGAVLVTGGRGSEKQVWMSERTW